MYRFLEEWEVFLRRFRLKPIIDSVLPPVKAGGNSSKDISDEMNILFNSDDLDNQDFKKSPTLRRRPDAYCLIHHSHESENSMETTLLRKSA